MGIEHSFLKPEALGSIPSIDTLKKKKRKRLGALGVHRN